jgi:hypothetical protein
MSPIYYQNKKNVWEYSKKKKKILKNWIINTHIYMLCIKKYFKLKTMLSERRRKK